MSRTVQALCQDIQHLTDELATASDHAGCHDDKALACLLACCQTLLARFENAQASDGFKRMTAAMDMAKLEYMLLGESDVIWEWRADSNMLTLSPRWGTLFHAALEQPLEVWCGQLHPDDRHQVHTLCRLARDGRQFSGIECRLRDGHGHWRFVRLRGMSMGCAASTSVIGVLSDITCQRYRDPITGLGNTELLNQLLDDALRGEYPHKRALIKITMVNAPLLSGSEHFCSARALEQRIAELLQTLFPASELIGLPGFSYALVTDFHGSDAMKDFLEPLQCLLNQPLDTEIGRAWLSHVIGVVPFAAGSSVSVEELRKRARLTLSNASGTGLGCVHYYSDELQTRANRASHGEQLIRAALVNDGVLCFLQPIVSVSEGGRVVAFEALMRLRDSEGNIAMPSAFIEAAESTGLIHLLSQQLIDKALQLLVDPAFAARFGQDFIININLSRHQLKDASLVDDMMRLIQRHGADPRRVNLEITESAVLAEPLVALRNLVRLREHGITIALDDFGSGYSSLSQLCELPLDCVKIDRRFVMDLEKEPRKRHVMTSVIDLCRRLDFRVVVEGVEESSTLRTVCDMGAEQIQGFIYARPMSFPDVLSRLDAVLLPVSVQPSTA